MTLIPPVRKGDLKHVPNHFHTSDQVSNESSLPGDSVSEALETTGYKTVKVSVTSAQIKNLFSNPVDLLPAPGVNKAYSIIQVIYKVNNATIPYATNTTLRIIYEGILTGSLASSAFILTKTGNSINQVPQFTAASGATDQQIATNKKVQLYVTTGNPTAGDGTMDIWLVYRVIDLS